MSWMESLSKNLIQNIEVNIGDNKTIAEMVDGNLKVEHYYKNETIIEKPVRVGVDVINRITSPDRDLISPPPNEKISKSNYQEYIGFCSMNDTDYNILLYNYEYDSCEIIIKHFSNKLYRLRVFNQDCKNINDYLLCDIKDKNDIITIDEKYDILILNINGHNFDLHSNIGYYLHYKIELSNSERTLVLIKITNLITDIDYIFEGNCKEHNTKITWDYFVDLINDDRIELIKLNFNIYDDYLLVSNEKQQIFHFNKKILSRFVSHLK